MMKLYLTILSIRLKEFTDRSYIPMPEADKLLRGIVSDVNNGLLGYKWKIRQFISSHPNHKLTPALDNLVNTSFDIITKVNQTDDTTLRAVVSLCSDPTMRVLVNSHDTDVDQLSAMFNMMIKSKRKLHKCYDCGTLARAMFLKIISKHRSRTHHFISDGEWEMIKTTYVPRPPSSNLSQCFNTIINTPSNMAIICSVGFKKFGHVFVITKQWSARDTTYKYRLFQSAMNNYMVLDYLEKCSPNQHNIYDIATFDIRDMYVDLKHLMQQRTWTNNTRRVFWKWFCFDPSVKILKTDPTSFCYAMVNI